MTNIDSLSKRLLSLSKLNVNIHIHNGHRYLEYHFDDYFDLSYRLLASYIDENTEFTTKSYGDIYETLDDIDRLLITKGFSTLEEMYDEKDWFHVEDLEYRDYLLEKNK